MEKDEVNELKSILREAFGESSSESDGEDSNDDPLRLQVKDCSDCDYKVKPVSIFGDAGNWESVNGINGLWICRDILSTDQQLSLMCALVKEGYLAQSSHNQAMRFGDLPSWAIELSYCIRESVATCDSLSIPGRDLTASDQVKENCVLPPELLWREPLFNQLIVNIYQPGEGICAHVDLLRFEDGIAIVSLESTCVMHFSPVELETDATRSKDSIPSSKIPVLLTPGSVVLMWGEARYMWKHEINRTLEFQCWDGKQIDQKRRTSITLRRLHQTE